MRHWVARFMDVGGCSFCLATPEKILCVETKTGLSLRICRACFKELFSIMCYVIGDAAIARGRNASAGRAKSPARRVNQGAARGKRAS